MRVFTRLSVAFKPRILPRADIRHLYQASADFIRFGPNGKIEKSKVPIRVGDPESTFVMIPTDVGHALQARDLLGQSSTAQTQDRSKLVSHHDTQHFANGIFLGIIRMRVMAKLVFRSVT